MGKGGKRKDGREGGDSEKMGHERGEQGRVGRRRELDRGGEEAGGWQEEWLFLLWCLMISLGKPS
jgi:hypothetical protein